MNAQLSLQINQIIGQILVKMITSRQSLFESSQKITFQSSLIECFIFYFDACSGVEKFLDILIEYAIKITSLFGYHRRFDNVEQAQKFEERVFKLTQLILGCQKKMTSESVNKLTIYYKKWLNQEKSHQNIFEQEQTKQIFIQFCIDYFNFFF